MIIIFVPGMQVPRFVSASSTLIGTEPTPTWRADGPTESAVEVGCLGIHRRCCLFPDFFYGRFCTFPNHELLNKHIACLVIVWVDCNPYEI